MVPRYAIYFVPAADSPLYRFGAAALGYDCYTGRDTAPITGMDASSWTAVVREPRVYGFHATLKAPFRLAGDFSEDDLLQAVQTFAESRPTVLGGRLVLREIGSFLALVPANRCADIERLAQACVQEFDRFRAPMTSEERARRLSAQLSPRQAEYLDRWGYPYVHDDFRFHMTLTGSLELSQLNTMRHFLDVQFEQVPEAQTLCIDRVAMVKQDESGASFRVIQPFALR
jgi:putative phosphonate metabolism protein